MDGGLGAGEGGRLSLALRALEEGHVDQAIQLLHLTVVTAPGNWEAHYALGRAYLVRENLPLAESEFRRAAELNPEHAESRCALGRLLLRQGRPEAARQPLEEALRLEGECAEARELLDSLPRPEDRLILSNLASADAATSIGLGDGQRPTRLLLVTGILFGSLALLLVVSLAWMRSVRSSGADAATPMPPVGTESGVPPAPSFTLSGPGAPPAGGPGAQGSSAGESGAPAGGTAARPGETGAAPALAMEPRRAAAEALRRLLIAQRAYHGKNGRYATLLDLESNGVIDIGAAAGRPLALYGNAVFSEVPPTELSFRITATLPDRTQLAIDQNSAGP